MNGMLQGPLGDTIALGTLALLYLGGLGIALWRIRAAPRGKLYWVVCTALLIGGAGAMLAEQPSSSSVGDMRPAFALGIEAVLAGLALVAAGCAWLMLRTRRPR